MSELTPRTPFIFNGIRLGFVSDYEVKFRRHGEGVALISVTVDTMVEDALDLVNTVAMIRILFDNGSCIDIYNMLLRSIDVTEDGCKYSFEYVETFTGRVRFMNPDTEPGSEIGLAELVKALGGQPDRVASFTAEGGFSEN